MAIQNVYRITIPSEGNATRTVVFSAKERDEILLNAKKRGKKTKVETMTFAKWKKPRSTF